MIPLLPELVGCALVEAVTGEENSPHTTSEVPQ